MVAGLDTVADECTELWGSASVQAVRQAQDDFPVGAAHVLAEVDGRDGDECGQMGVGAEERSVDADAVAQDAALSDAETRSLIPVADSIDTIVDRVYRHQSLQPLVDAARKLDEPPPAQPGHFPWCRTDSCVVSRDVDGETNTEHVGPSVDMPIPSGMDVGHDELLHAFLCADDASGSDPCVSFNSGGNGVLLDPGELDTIIDNLADFLDGLRSLRSQMTAKAVTRSTTPSTYVAPSAHASLTHEPRNEEASEPTKADPDAA